MQEAAKIEQARGIIKRSCWTQNVKGAMWLYVEEEKEVGKGNLLKIISLKYKNCHINFFKNYNRTLKMYIY